MLFGITQGVELFLFKESLKMTLLMVLVIMNEWY